MIGFQYSKSFLIFLIVICLWFQWRRIHTLWFYTWSAKNYTNLERWYLKSIKKHQNIHIYNCTHCIIRIIYVDLPCAVLVMTNFHWTSVSLYQVTIFLCKARESHWLTSRECIYGMERQTWIRGTASALRVRFIWSAIFHVPDRQVRWGAEKQGYFETPRFRSRHIDFKKKACLKYYAIFVDLTNSPKLSFSQKDEMP